VLAVSSRRTVWQASYTPFGEAGVNVADVELPLRLPGQYADAETGTHYNYYRDYDPATGRYLTSDPIGLAGGANAYVYAEGDPLGSIDALGLRAGPVGAPGLVIVQPLIARPPIGTPGSPWVRRPPVSGPPNRQMRTDRYRVADAALRRFEPDRALIVSSPDWSPDWNEVFDVEYELYAAHHEYYLRYRDAEACDAGYDPALWGASMRAAAQYGNVYGPLVQTDPLPRETLDRIREVYGRDYERYRANGGTGSFEQWLLDGRPEDALPDSSRTPVVYEGEPTEHERRAAETLADFGRIVRVRGVNVEGPDLLVDGIYWELKQLKGTSQRSLKTAILSARTNFRNNTAVALGLAPDEVRVIVDARGNPEWDSAEKVRNEFFRFNGSPDLRSIQKLIVMTSEGLLYWP